jgi:hypothetical protein
VNEFGSLDELYSFLDLLADRLATEGLTLHASKIRHRLHSVAWTSASELIDELCTVLQAVQLEPELHTPSDVSEGLARSIRFIRSHQYPRS